MHKNNENENQNQSETDLKDELGLNQAYNEPQQQEDIKKLSDLEGDLDDLQEEISNPKEQPTEDKAGQKEGKEIPTDTPKVREEAFNEFEGEPKAQTEDKPKEWQEEQENKSTSRELKFLSLDEIMKKPTKTNWLIKDYLDTESLCVLFGESGCMKSFLAIDIGLSIATSKTDWHGAPIKTSGSVFYIIGEGHKGVGKRFKAWFQENNIEKGPFFTTNQAIQLLDKKSAEECVKKIDALYENHGRPVLVIVDTLNRNFGDGDENTTEDMTKFVYHIDTFIRLHYGCAVIIVHHSPLNDPTRARGASALRASLDWEYSLSTLSKERMSPRRLVNTKVKEYEPPSDIIFEPISVSLEGWVDDEDNEKLMTSCILKKMNGTFTKDDKKQKLTGGNKIALDCLIKLMKEKDIKEVHIDVWRNEAYEASISITNTPQSKKKAFQRAVKELRDKGYIEAKNEYYFLVGDKGTLGDIKGDMSR